MREVLTPRILVALRVMQSHLQKWYYTRELAELSKTGRTTISDEFPGLVKQGILNRRVEGREVYYRFNLSNTKARKLCELFETERREKVYQQNKRLSWALQEFSKRVFDVLPEIQSVILFGSAARGQLTKTSDVDLLVLVPNLEQGPFNELMKSVDKLAADTRGKYGFQLSAVPMTIREFEAGFRERKRITEDVAREGIVLFGEDRYYALLGRLIA
jgi:predicted nucleotidyltransferase/DNA-binding transcriptional ArsR family regulator